MEPITSDAVTLMRQAVSTANTYFIGAIESIDEQFGEGYAKAHPELVGDFIKVCAKDFDTGVRAGVRQDATEAMRARVAGSLPSEN